MRGRIRWALGALGVCCLVAQAGQAAAAAPAAPARPSVPLRDPFARPMAPAPEAEAPVAQARAETGSLGVALNAAEAPAEWVPELRAVIYDRNHSLVNISGTVLGTGETVHGFRVVKINERSVVIAQGKVTRTLTLDNRDGSP